MAIERLVKMPAFIFPAAGDCRGELAQVRAGELSGANQRGNKLIS